MAGEAYHHGPEIFEITLGTETVSDIKAAVTFLIGTAPIHLVHTTPEARAKFINQPIIIRRKSDAVAAFGPAAQAAGYSINEALEAAFNKDKNNQGIGTYIVVNVFNPDIHKDGASPDPTKVVASDIIGGLDLAGRPLGVEIAYACFGRFGFFPRRIIAPRFTGLTGVRAKMQIVANKIRGHCIWDLPPGMTKQAAIEARGVNGTFNVGDERVVLCYPQLLALDPVTGGMSLQPYSQHLAAIWNQTASTLGPHESPSNRPMPDVTGTETDIYYLPGDYSSDTDLLNAAGIVTTMTSYGAGINTWGASSAAWPVTKSPTAWLHGRAILDVVEEAVLTYCQPKTDKLGLPNVIESLEDRVTAWLRTKERDGWLYGSRFSFNRQKNTADEIAGEGRFWWKLDTMPVGVMHRISIESYLDLNFINTALGLGAGAVA